MRGPYLNTADKNEIILRVLRNKFRNTRSIISFLSAVFRYGPRTCTLFWKQIVVVVFTRMRVSGFIQVLLTA